MALVLGTGALLASAPASDARTTTRAQANACRSASQHFYDYSGSSRLLAMDDPTSGLDTSPAVWLRPDSEFAGVTVRPERGLVRLRICTVVYTEVRVIGAPVTVPADQRATKAFVADPWLAWVTTSRREGFVLHRRTIGGRRETRRRFHGTLRGLAMTRDGTAVVSTLAGHEQRVWRWRTDRRTDAPIPPVTVGPAGVENDSVHVELWDPDTVLLTAPADVSATEGLAPRPLTRLLSTAPTRACPVWGDGEPVGESPGSTRTVLGDVAVTLTPSAAWSARSVDAGGEWVEDLSSTRHLEACDLRTGARTLAVTAGYDRREPAEEYGGLTRVALVGGAIFATGYHSNGADGSGSVGGVLDAAYVPDGTGGYRRATYGVATPTAAAWVLDGAVQVADADGTRTVGPVPAGFGGLRLRADGTSLAVVAGTQEESVPLRPLGPGQSAFPSTGGLIPHETRFADGTVAADNFGICEGQTSSYCPDPTVPPTDR